MKTIYKYPLEVTDRQTLMLPAHPEFLTVVVQREQPCIWALIDTNAELLPFTINMCGTGRPCHHGRDEYLGTVLLLDGELVLHVFVAANSYQFVHLLSSAR